MLFNSAFAAILLPFVLIVSDLLARCFPVVTSFAAAIWIVLMAAVAVFTVIDLTILSITSRRLIFLLLVAAMWAGDILLLQDTRFIQHETTQQIGCALRQMSEEGSGFLRSCFLGYPTRGYYLSALPSVIFGTDPVALNLTQHLWLFSGLCAFAAGIYRLVPGWRAEIVALFAMAAGLSSEHLPYLFKSYEQSLGPASLSFLFTGFLLSYLAAGRVYFLGLAASAGIIAAFAYTPALALSLLCGALLVYLAWERRSALIFFLSLCSLAAPAIALYSRHDLRLQPQENAPSNIEVLQQIWFRIWRWEDNSLGQPLILISLLALLLVAVLRAVRLRGQVDKRTYPLYSSAPILALLLLLWIAAVCFISVRSPGYANPEAHFALHRAAFVLPLASGFIVWLLAVPRPVPLFILLLMAVVGGFSVTQTWRQTERLIVEQPDNLRFQLLHLIRSLRAADKLDENAVSLYMEAPIGEPFMSIMDYNEYFSTLKFFEAVPQCKDLRHPDAKVLILRRKQLRFCDEQGELRCFDARFAARPELELCELKLQKRETQMSEEESN